MQSWTLWFDGSCQPFNPGGHCCGGWVVKSSVTGDKVRDGAAYFGHGEGMTNNVAEYKALLAGLTWIAEQPGPVALNIKGDSKLVVHQVSGRWKGKKAHLLMLRDECLAVLRRITTDGGRWAIAWIPRDKNDEADALSTSLQADLPKLDMTKEQRQRAWVMANVHTKKGLRKVREEDQRAARQAKVKRHGMCNGCGQRAKRGKSRCTPCQQRWAAAGSALAVRHPDLAGLVAAVLAGGRG